jgi:prevent-host-death family protein
MQANSLDRFSPETRLFSKVLAHPLSNQAKAYKLDCELVGSLCGWMEETMATIGIFEAKTRLSEIVRQVEAGERFTITVHGEAKAQVVPIPAPNPVHSPEEVEAAYQRLRNPRIKGISHEEIRAAIEEGRP